MGSSRQARSLALAVAVKWESPVPDQSVEEYYQAQQRRAAERRKAEEQERAAALRQSPGEVLAGCLFAVVALLLGLAELGWEILKFVVGLAVIYFILDFIF